jgi:hypothetical protein
MGKPALGLADLLQNTGRQHGLGGHVEEPVFDRRRAGVDYEDLHKPPYVLRISDCRSIQIWILDFGFWIKKIIRVIDNYLFLLDVFIEDTSIAIISSFSFIISKLANSV